MASLKEIKNRINSVNSTRKITSAMKMIASSKLHKAQNMINNFLPYQKKLDEILVDLAVSDQNYEFPLLEKREVKRSAIVVFSSNSSLCGAFNASIIKEFRATYTNKLHLGKDNVLLYPIGKKIAEAMRKSGLKTEGDYKGMADKPSYNAVQTLAKDLIGKYLNKEIDEVRLIFFHFKSVGTQILTNKPFLPFDLAQIAPDEKEKEKYPTDYILEPSREEILERFVPTVLYARLYAALLHSSASEHAARTIAMQVATDNADDLKQDLTIQYNKTRQQAVTNELLDIIGGAAALQ